KPPVPQAGSCTVSPVAEVGFLAGGFVFEVQEIVPARQMRRYPVHVPQRLIGHAAQGGAGFFCLDDACRPAADKQQIVAGPADELELAHGDAFGRVAVERGHILEYPARACEERVYRLPGALFRRCHGTPLNAGPLPAATTKSLVISR